MSYNPQENQLGYNSDIMNDSLVFWMAHLAVRLNE